jgi:hypothetical protein
MDFITIQHKEGTITVRLDELDNLWMTKLREVV